MILETPPPVATNQSTNTNGQSNNQSAASIQSASQSGKSMNNNGQSNNQLAFIVTTYQTSQLTTVVSQITNQRKIYVLC